MGNAGMAILYVLSMAALAILGLYFTMYAARCLLVVVDQTAAGNKEVTWPDEPMMDWFGQGLHLVWLLIFCFVPAWFLSQVLAAAVPETVPWQGAIFLASVWLIFPVCLLSNMTATSRWVVLHPRFLRGAAYHFGPMLLFYLLSGVLLAGAGYLIALTQSGGWNLVLLSPAILTAIWMMYARLLGRVAHRIGQQPVPDKPPAKKSVPRVETDSQDPWAAPEDTGEEEQTETASESPTDPVPAAGAGAAVEEEDEWTMRPKAYGVIFDDSRKDWWERKTQSLVEDPGVYEMSTEKTAAEDDTDISSSPRKKKKAEADLPVSPVSEEELERALELRRGGKPRIEERPSVAKEFFVGIFEFPWYPSSVAAWGFLSFLGVLFSVIIRCVQIFQPPE